MSDTERVPVKMDDDTIGSALVHPTGVIELEISANFIGKEIYSDIRNGYVNALTLTSISINPE